jgi:hypothetical protein
MSLTSINYTPTYAPMHLSRHLSTHLPTHPQLIGAPCNTPIALAYRTEKIVEHIELQDQLWSMVGMAAFFCAMHGYSSIPLLAQSSIK